MVGGEKNSPTALLVACADERLSVHLTACFNDARSAVSEFLGAWATVCDNQDRLLKAMTQRERSQIDCSARARWEQSVRTLATHVDGVDTSQGMLTAGFLIWRPKGEELGPDARVAETLPDSIARRRSSQITAAADSAQPAQQ